MRPDRRPPRPSADSEPRAGRRAEPPGDAAADAGSADGAPSRDEMTHRLHARPAGRRRRRGRRPARGRRPPPARPPAGPRLRCRSSRRSSARPASTRPTRCWPSDACAADRRRHRPDGRRSPASSADRPSAILDLWRLDELRGIALDGDALVLGALTTYTDIRRSALCTMHAAGPGRGGRDHRCRPDPEPRHDRRQRRQRLAGRRHAAGPAGRWTPSSCCGGARGERDGARDRLLARLPSHGARPGRAPPARSGSRCAPVASMRFRKVGTRRAQAICKVVMALAWREDGGASGATSASPSGPWRRRPIRAAETEARPRGRRADAGRSPTARPRRCAAELQPIDDVRSTAEYRRAVAARVLHRLLRDAGGW